MLCVHCDEEQCEICIYLNDRIGIKENNLYRYRQIFVITSQVTFIAGGHCDDTIDTSNNETAKSQNGWKRKLLSSIILFDQILKL